ncbi:MAG: amidohydrolase, partial [Bacteroidota bacterium]|nr:amidohydrolase [Bacteroidota bacterium]
MTFQKLKADRIFTGTKMLESNSVLICDASGVVHEIIDEQQAGDDVRNVAGVLTPGFINCHCHLELSHMKRLIPEKTGLVDFVFSVVTQRHFLDE